jgi:hypothetical protein
MNLRHQFLLTSFAAVLHIRITPMVKMGALCDHDIQNTGIWTCIYLKCAWWRVGWLLNTNVLILAIDVLGGAAKIGSSSGQGQPTGGTGRWFPPFSHMMFMFWNDLHMMIYY